LAGEGTVDEGERWSGLLTEPFLLGKFVRTLIRAHIGVCERTLQASVTTEAEVQKAMQRASPAAVAVVEPVVTGLGYEFVGAEFGQGDGGPTLRVYIDNPAGVDVDDCVKVSRQLDAALDVDDVIPGAYQLEVSSPGVDRPLFSLGHFEAQQGEEVRIRLLAGIGGRRNYKGRLLAVGDGNITIEVDQVDHVLPLADVEQAYLIGRLP